MEPASSWTLVKLITAEPLWELLFFFFSYLSRVNFGIQGTTQALRNSGCHLFPTQK